MAKSLEELQLAFQAKYPQTEDNQQVEVSPKDIETRKDETVIEKPKTVIEKPEAVIAKPETIIAKPKAVIEKPETVIAKPKTVIAKDQSISEKKIKEQLESRVDDIKQEVEKEQSEKEQSGAKVKQKKTSIVSDILFYATLFLMVIFAFLFSRGTMGNEAFGGIKLYEVLTTSMESVYPRGSLVVIKQTDAGDLVVGDDIAFMNASNDLITHRIVEVKENYEETGKRAFTTKGVDNAVADEAAVLAENVVGKVIKGIPKLGAMLTWLGANLWVIVLFFLSLIAFSFFLKKFWQGKEIDKQDDTKVERKKLKKV